MALRHKKGKWGARQPRLELCEPSVDDMVSQHLPVVVGVAAPRSFQRHAPAFALLALVDRPAFCRPERRAAGWLDQVFLNKPKWNFCTLPHGVT